MKDYSTNSRPNGAAPITPPPAPPSKSKKSKAEPRLLLADNDGNWYLIPESKAKIFEDMLGVMSETNYGDFDLPARFEKDFNQYQIDGPHALIILRWEEM